MLDKTKKNVMGKILKNVDWPALWEEAKDIVAELDDTDDADGAAKLESAISQLSERLDEMVTWEKLPRLARGIAEHLDGDLIEILLRGLVEAAVLRVRE